MEERFQCSPNEVRGMNTAQLREAFVIPRLMKQDGFHFTYSHYDRVVIGGAMPAAQTLSLATYPQLKSDFFLQRRELGIINVGGQGTITVEGEAFTLDKLDCLYVGKGVKEIAFSSVEENNPAQYFLLSAPAHQSYPTRLMKSAEATPAHLGSVQTSNERTIYKYIHEEGIKSCQLVMGLTVLKPGSVWNTMPAHTHNRRMEVYLYFDVPEEHRVFHFMGQPQETRHVLMGNTDAVISAPWSIHSGCGTTSYSFIWGMAGENQSFADMDFVNINELL